MIRKIKTKESFLIMGPFLKERDMPLPLRERNNEIDEYR